MKSRTVPTSLLLLLVVVLSIGCLVLPGCSSGSDSPSSVSESAEQSDEVIEITEKLFIAQSNDVYINREDYLGKTIKLEGLFITNDSRDFIIRYGPGCCGDDGEAGFEIVWSGPMPMQNDWCEAIGVLEEYERDGWMSLRLNLSSLTVLDERGAETVSV